MKKITFLLLITMSLFVFNSCDEDIEGTKDLNFVTFANTSYTAGIDVGGSSIVDILVYTTNITGSSRSFNVNIDVDNTDAAAGSYTVPASVTVEGGTNEGTLSVNLSDVNLGIGVNKLVIDFETVSGLSNGGNTTIYYTQNCNEVNATLDINFDYYASETSWNIFDSLGGVVLSGGGYSNGQAPVSLELALCAGRDYTLVFYDAYSDGMDDGTNLGSYTLTIGGVVKATGGGSFGASESNSFDTN